MCLVNLLVRGPMSCVDDPLVATAVATSTDCHGHVACGATTNSRQLSRRRGRVAGGHRAFPRLTHVRRGDEKRDAMTRRFSRSRPAAATADTSSPSPFFALPAKSVVAGWV